MSLVRILIVKLSALGDVLRTTSLLGPLRRRRPRAEIWWVTAPAAAPLLRRNPLIKRVLAPRRLGALRAPAGGFDLVLSLEEGPAAEFAAKACRGSLIGVYPTDGGYRYTDSSAAYYGMSLLNRDPDGSLKTADRLKAANRLTYAGLWLKIIGLPAPRGRRGTAPFLALSDRERAGARASARRHSLDGPIGLNPGAGARWPAKQLSVERSAALAARLARLGRPVLLLGGPDEAARNREIARRAGAGVVDAGCRRSLRSFAAFIELCSVIVTTDSLALHLANALDIPAVVLVGPTSPAELDVYGRGEIMVPADGCSCFYKPRCARAVSCLDEIPLERIAGAAGRWLGRC